MPEDFYRIKRLPPYVFSEVNALKAKARAAGRDIIVTLGSKEGLANLAQAITAPGDIVLVPNPCYPIHAFGFIMAGASVRHVPVGPELDFLGELRKALQHSVPAPLAIVLNFPANPTAQTVDLDFYGEIVAFCRQHKIVVLSDIAN